MEDGRANAFGFVGLYNIFVFRLTTEFSESEQWAQHPVGIQNMSSPLPPGAGCGWPVPCPFSRRMDLVHLLHFYGQKRGKEKLIGVARARYRVFDDFSLAARMDFQENRRVGQMTPFWKGAPTTAVS